MEKWLVCALPVFNWWGNVEYTAADTSDVIDKSDLEGPANFEMYTQVRDGLKETKTFVQSYTEGKDVVFEPKLKALELIYKQLEEATPKNYLKRKEKFDNTIAHIRSSEQIQNLYTTALRNKERRNMEARIKTRRKGLGKQKRLLQ